MGEEGSMNSHLKAQEDEERNLQGIVYKIEIKEKLQYLYIEQNNEKYLIYDTSFQSVRIGNEILATGQYQLFESEPNPGNFNQKKYYNIKKIKGYLWAKSLEVTSEDIYWLRNKLYEMRGSIKNQIYQFFDSEKGGFMVALLLGEQDGLEPIDREMFQKVGVGHIFAISGLHISILGIALYKVLKKWIGKFMIAAVISSTLLLLYVIMIGSGVSAARAAIMFFVAMGAELSGRGYDSLTSVSVAALGILIYNPNQLFDAGFLLSFGAVIGILGIYPIMSSCLEKWGKLGGTIAASISIQVMIFPMLLQYFYEISIYSILTNLLILPVLGIVLISGIVGVICSFLIGNMAAPIFLICKLLISYIYKVGELSLNLPFARVILGQPDARVLLFYYLSTFGLIGYAIWKKKKSQGEVKWNQKAILIWLVVTVSTLWIDMPTQGIIVTLLNVGQGDSMYLKGAEGIDYLIDGGSSSETEVGKYRIEPFLKSRGVERLEYVFVTHGDKDHINGISELIEREAVGIKIDTLVMCKEKFQDQELIQLKNLAMKHQIRVLEIGVGDRIEEGEMVIEVIAPMEEFQGEIGNESSLVLDVNYKEFSMLCTGDVEGEGEEDLLEYLETEDKKYDVLKVAHHGSKNSTSHEFLEQIDAEIALISAGKENPYGHPHEELLERVKEYVKYTYETANSGAIVLKYY